MKILICVIVIVFSIKSLSAAEASEDVVAKVSETILKYKVVKGKFKQEKKIKKLKISMHSSGKFEMTSKSFVWLQKKPIIGRYEINQTQMKQKVSDQPELVVARNAAPEVAMISDMMVCIVSGKSECLKKNFEILDYKKKPSGQWEFSLKPKKSLMQKVMSSLNIKGNPKFVTGINFIENSGNSTFISFFAVKGEE